MLQAQHRGGASCSVQHGQSGRTTTGGGSVGTVGSRSSEFMSKSTADRKALLGQSYYEDAKNVISQALTSDEVGDRMQALELYNQSLSLIRTGLASMRSNTGLGIRDDSMALHEMRSKMEKMKEQIKSRMEVLLQLELEERSISKSIARQPTSSSTSTAGKTGSTSSTASRLSSSVCSSTTSISSGRDGSREEVKADMLFNADRGIALFAVDKKEHVRKFEDVDAINVFQYREKIKGQPPAFLQCGGFVYPLIPGKSPILKTSDKVYMFPELKSDDGSTVGVVMDSTSDEEVARLDALLGQLADLRKVDITATVEKERRREVEVATAVEDTAPPTWGSSVAGGIDKGVSWMSTKITKGTEVAGNLILTGANKLREKIDPNDKPTEIPESVQKGVHYTRKATGCVVGVSNFLMTSLAKLTVKVGKGVKDVVAETETVKNMEVNPHAIEAWKATKSGIKGAATVFTDLERGAVAVVKSMGKETSKTVGHKYGEDAGKVADDSLVAAGHGVNLVTTYWSWKTWGIRFIGKVGEVIASDATKEKSDTKTDSK